MQSKQSNGTVFFRALVMLVFLGGIFYAALNGNALPDALRKKIEMYLPSSLVANKPSTAENANQSAEAKANGDAPLFNIPSDNKPPVASPVADPAPRKLATDGSATLLSPPSANIAMPAQSSSNPAGIVPVNYQAPVETPAIATGANPFLQIQERLKQLGATYYLLETWGTEQQFYRFYCRMAVGGNVNYAHCFESTANDPIKAMNEVLRQVEDWRKGGSTLR